jgi:hypothetical protein
MSSRFRHNKKRNTGLAYELLTRKLGSQMVVQDAAGASQTLRIVKEYYSHGTPMARERDLFEVIVGNRGMTEEGARKVVSMVALEASKIDARKLDIKKSNLIKEVHHTFGQGFFDEFRIPTYRLLASVQLFLDGCRGSSRLSEGIQRVQLEEGIVKYMTTTDQEHVFQRDSEVDGLVVKLATEKFEERYGRDLTGTQRGILESYSQALFDEDMDRVAKVLFDEKKRILKILRESRNIEEVRGDQVTRERFTETISRLERLNVTDIKDETVEEMLLYCKLAEELNSDER